jgi:hypothetical protein
VRRFVVIDRDGRMVGLTDEVGFHSDALAIVALARTVEGVVDVDDRLE